MGFSESNLAPARRLLCSEPSFKRGRPGRDQVSPWMGISSRLHIHQACKGDSDVLTPSFGPSQSEKIFATKEQLPNMSQTLIGVAVQWRVHMVSLFYSVYMFNILHNGKFNKMPEEELWTVVIQLIKQLRVVVIHHDSGCSPLTHLPCHFLNLV